MITIVFPISVALHRDLIVLALQDIVSTAVLKSIKHLLLHDYQLSLLAYG